VNVDGALGLARRSELYPGVILHGGAPEERRDAALAIGRTLLCERPPEERPCGECRHCRRIVWPVEAGSEDGGFHPDFQVLERDLKTSTSVDATKRFLRTAQVSPFEARGQVLVVASAESLSGEAANSLLKTLEEPHISAPRHFLLLTPSRLDLLPTLRSRCLSVFLGGSGRPDGEAVGELADALAGCFARWSDDGSAAWLLVASAAIEGAADWSEARSGAPWALAAAAVVAARERPGVPPELSPRLLALAEDLLAAPGWRLRAVPAGRILDGLMARRLTAAVPSVR
jgi:DNA polymerase III, delta subunit